ncbi:type III secretion system needle filament subunit SctF [Pantoea ananatis]|jgi:type III secretion protein F|uniref:type III secretion system needle filament subunit SctF n=1 Tax=Pantoea ananas TaxID=553 RepID=UPI0024ADAF87|nr:type III secretion system needle filament subunit SctF [Pantoea ananatis]MDI6539596.1 type III secretion system needle filament subunit SctF [Pantoea ananatis]
MADKIVNDVTSNVGFDDANFLDGTAHRFETGATKLMGMLKDAQTQMESDPSNPSMLAAYQAKLQAYTLFRNAQTSTVKVYKDVGSAIIQNFR